MSVMGLGLAARAANTFFADQEAKRASRIKEEREARRWKSEEAGLDAADTTRPYATEAAVTGAMNTADANRSQLRTRPGETENAIARQGIESVSLERAAARQGTVEEANDLNAQTNTNNAKVNSALSNVRVEDLPLAVADARRAGVLQSEQVQTAVLGGLATLLGRGDNAGVIKYMNDMAKASGGGGPEIVRVGTINVGGRNVFVAQDAAGASVFQIPLDSLKNMVKQPGEKVIVKPGETVGMLSPDGTYKPSYTAPETSGSRSEKMGPLERDVTYLMDAHGMGQQQALQYLNSAKSMTRQQFILKGIENLTAIGKTATQDDIANFGTLYDSASAIPANPGLGAGSNNSAPGKKDPRIDGLLGIP